MSYYLVGKYQTGIFVWTIYDSKYFIQSTNRIEDAPKICWSFQANQLSSHFRVFRVCKTEGATQQVGIPSMKTSGKRKDSGLVNKLPDPALLSWVLPTYRDLILLYRRMGKRHVKKWPCVARFSTFKSNRCG